MHQLRRKLNSQSGASMLVALLFLFFCAAVGAIVLTAASVNAGRQTRTAAEQQAYLAVESAALLLREDFADLKLEGQFDHKTMERVTVLEDDTVQVETWVEYAEGSTKLTQTPLRTLAGIEQDLEALFLATCGHFPGRTQPSAMTYPLTITSDKGLPEVAATVTVSMADKNRYAITVVLKTAEGDNPMTLRFGVKAPVESRSAPSVSVSGNTTTTTVTHTWTYGWLTPTITKGEVTTP